MSNYEGIKYKFDEGKFLEACRVYLDSTYSEHYAGKPQEGKNIQLMELLGANELALPFAQAAAMKYILRYGKKGGFNKKDLLKAVHYIVFMSFFTPEGE